MDLSSQSNAEIEVFPQKFGLPSFDPDSLAVLAYSKFGNALVNIQTEHFGRFRFLSQKGAIPALTNQSNTVGDVESIIDVLRELKFGTDFELSQKQCADTVAFIELMKLKLRPAVMHTFWLEKGNYEDLTREAYATVLPLPAAIFYPRWRRLEAFDFVYTSEGGDMTFLEESDIENKVYKDAEFCLNYLSNKLSTQSFLFGDKPTTADALMFGYLAPLLKMSFPKNRLKGHIEKYQNLCNTIDHILRRYFSPPKPDIHKMTSVTKEDKEFPNQVRDIFIAVVFGLTVMVTYSLLRGVISFQISEVEDID